MSTSLALATTAANQVLADSAVHAGVSAAAGGAVGGGLLLAGLTWAIWRYMSSHRLDQSSGSKKFLHSHRANTVGSMLIGLLLGSATAIGVGAAHMASMIP